MKITNKNLARIIEIANTTPVKIRDYCNRDGCATEWHRKSISHRSDGDELVYFCYECGTKRHYNLGRLKEYKDLER